MKRIIEKSASELDLTLALYENNMSSYFQILAIDYNRIEELKLKKRTIFDSIRAKLRRQKTFDETQIYGTKKEKIVQYYYIIPEEIEKKKEELAKLKWNDLKRKRVLKKEIRDLKNKKAEYYDSILKWYSNTNKSDEEEQMQIKWQEFYLSHEDEMLQWIDYKKSTLSPDISADDRKAFLISYCEEYFQSINSFCSKVEALKEDVRNNVELLRAVFCKDHENASLSQILQELRKAMDGNLLPKGMTKYRTYNIPITASDKFFIMSSNAMDIKNDMQQLEDEYEELKKIENREEYINKAIYIFQRFIQIHPYIDGNGRTSRALLDIMLINRDIIPPVLYDTYYQRGKLDRLSMEYLSESNKKPLQDYIKEQINKMQPNADSQNEKEEKTFLNGSSYGKGDRG